MTTKQQFRQQVLKHRRNLSAVEHTAASIHIQKNLLVQLEQRTLSTMPLLIYRAMDDEVETRDILATNRTLMFAPATHAHNTIQWHETSSDTEWNLGTYGVEEPTGGRIWTPELGKAVLVCPLVGFDRAGNRLGFGKGYFDRWLAQFKHHILIIIGLAFSCQEVPNIPIETHDVPLNTIITEQEIIECRKH